MNKRILIAVTEFIKYSNRFDQSLIQPAKISQMTIASHQQFFLFFSFFFIFLSIYYFACLCALLFLLKLWIIFFCCLGMTCTPPKWMGSKKIRKICWGGSKNSDFGLGSVFPQFFGKTKKCIIKVQKTKVISFKRANVPISTKELIRCIRITH